MYNINIEKRAIEGKSVLTIDLVHHIYSRGPQKKVIIIASDPVAIMPRVKRQWLRLILDVKLERSSTLKSSRILELSKTLVWMQNLSFSQKVVSGQAVGDINFLTANAVLGLSAMCETLYIISSINDKIMSNLISAMPETSVVVVYGK